MTQPISPDFLLRGHGDIAPHRSVRAFLGRPRALEPPHFHTHTHARVQPLRRNHQRIERRLREEGCRRAPQPAVEENLQDRAIDDDVQAKGLRVRVDQVRDAELVGEERVVEPADVAPVDPEGRVAAEEEAAPHRFPAHGREEGEVRRAGRVRGGDPRRVQGKMQGSAWDRDAVIIQE